MAIKTYDRDQAIQIPKQIPKQILQLPAQIPQNLKIPNHKKVIPLEKPPIPVCYGYKPTPEEDECGLCSHCYYNQDHNTLSSCGSCDTRTNFNKAHQTESQFREMQQKVLNERIDEIDESLKHL